MTLTKFLIFGFFFFNINFWIISTIQINLVQSFKVSSVIVSGISRNTYRLLHKVDVIADGFVLIVGCHARVQTLIESLVQARAISVNRRARGKFQQRHNSQECAILIPYENTYVYLS